jgi:ketosteroid isomerase-like protein
MAIPEGVLPMIAPIVLVTSAVGQLPAAPSKAEEEVRRVEREWLDAYEQSDAAATERIVADDFTITFPDGIAQTKPQLVALVRAQRKVGQPAPKFSTADVKSRAYGDTVILIGKVVAESRRDGKAVREESRYTDTYVKRDGRWQVVASHLSNAGQPKK